MGPTGPMGIPNIISSLVAMTYARPAEQPNRKGLQINHAISRGAGRGQFRDQNQVFEHVQKLVAAISGRRPVLHSRTTIARSVACLVVWSHDG